MANFNLGDMISNAIKGITDFIGGIFGGNKNNGGTGTAPNSGGDFLSGIGDFFNNIFASFGNIFNGGGSAKKVSAEFDARDPAQTALLTSAATPSDARQETSLLRINDVIHSMSAPTAITTSAATSTQAQDAYILAAA